MLTQLFIPHHPRPIWHYFDLFNAVNIAIHFAASIMHRVNATEYSFVGNTSTQEWRPAYTRYDGTLWYHSTGNSTFIQIRATGKDCMCWHRCPLWLHVLLQHTSLLVRHFTSAAATESVQAQTFASKAYELDKLGELMRTNFSTWPVHSKQRCCVCLPPCPHFTYADFIQRWWFHIHAADMLLYTAGYPLSKLPLRS